MKKRLISILFALVFGIIFCISASATESELTKTEKWIEQTGRITSGVFDCTLYDGYSVTTQRLYLNDNKMMCEMEADGFKIGVIVEGDDLTVFNPDMRLFHIKYKDVSSNIAEIFETIPAEFEYESVETYECTEADKTYYVEEFVFEDGTVCKCYFLGDELAFIESDTLDGSETVTARTAIVSYEVDDEIFELPWYSINLYPLVAFFMDLRIF